MASDLQISFTSLRFRNQLPSKPSMVTSGSSAGMGGKREESREGEGKRRGKGCGKGKGENEMGRDEGAVMKKGKRLQGGKDDRTRNVREGNEREGGKKGHGRGRERR